MPCSAIAVAKGQVPLNLACEPDGLGTEAVTQALLALLRQRCAHLGQPELTSLWGAHSGARMPGIGVWIGNVLVRAEIHTPGGLAFHLVYAETLDRVFVALTPFAIGAERRFAEMIEAVRDANGW